MSYCIIKNKDSWMECKLYYKYKECTNLHREDGPAIEWANGDKAWYINGKLHRDNGPAVDYYNDKQYFLNGKKYSEKNYWAIIKLGAFV